MTLVNDKLKNHLQCVQSSQPYQKLIDQALELEQRGGQINMCNALEELRQEETVNYIKILINGLYHRIIRECGKNS